MHSCVVLLSKKRKPFIHAQTTHSTLSPSKLLKISALSWVSLAVVKKHKILKLMDTWVNAKMDDGWLGIVTQAKG